MSDCATCTEKIPAINRISVEFVLVKYISRLEKINTPRLAGKRFLWGYLINILTNRGTYSVT